MKNYYRSRAMNLALMDSYTIDYSKRTELSKEILNMAEQYKTQITGRSIALYSQDIRAFMFIPYISRFHREYQIKQLIRIKEFQKILQNLNVDHFYFITLTIPYHLNKSLKQGQIDINKRLNKTWTILKDRIKKFEPEYFFYVRVAEIQELNTMNIHYHLALIIKDDVNKESQYWKLITATLRELFGAVIDVKTIWKYDIQKKKDRSKFLFLYLLKYITKSIKAKEITITQAILWALNARVINFSRFHAWKYDYRGTFSIWSIPNEYFDNGDLNTAKGGRIIQGADFSDVPEISWIVLGSINESLNGIISESELEKNNIQLLEYLFYILSFRKDT